MSESLIFAILGFLVACLFGTVIASFLWRRAVAVTRRNITEDENFASLEEVADLKAEIRELHDAQRAGQREIKAREIEIAKLEDAKLKADDNNNLTNKALREELTTAETALQKAYLDRDAAQSALTAEQDAARALLDAKQTELASARDRVGFLERAIRTLAKTASDLVTEAPAEAAEPSDASIEHTETGGDAEREEKEATPAASDAAASAAPKSAATTSDSEPKAAADESVPTAPYEENLDPAALDVTRSLEERIEALKQGQSTH